MVDQNYEFPYDKIGATHGEKYLQALEKLEDDVDTWIFTFRLTKFTLGAIAIGSLVASQMEEGDQTTTIIASATAIGTAVIHQVVQPWLQRELEEARSRRIAHQTIHDKALGLW